MSLETAKQRLALKHCTSHIKPMPARAIGGQEELEALLRETMTANAVVVLWEMQAIIWGKWKDGKISFASGEEVVPEYWQELRVFNGNEELHLRRVGDSFTGRYRKDEGEDGATAYVDSFSRFWGEKTVSSDGFVTLVDSSRKLKLVIPAEDGSRWYGLQTRNYVGSDKETGLSGYADYRFVHIASAEEGK